MSKYEIEWHDSEALWKFAMENCEVAETCHESRRKYAVALKELKLALAKAYKANPDMRKMSEEKAYLVLADRSEECREYLKDLIECESEYKGIEKILEARQAAVSFNQSLIKNQVRNT